MGIAEKLIRERTKAEKMKKIILVAILSILLSFAVDLAISIAHPQKGIDSCSAIFTDGREVTYTNSCEITENHYVITGGDPFFGVSANEEEEVSQIHILFGERLKQWIDLQLFYVFSGGGINETDSIHTRIPQGATDYVIEVPRAKYSSFRFDIEQNVVLKGIYSENGSQGFLPYRPHAIRIIFFSLEAFALIFILISCVSKMKHETPDKEWRGINSTILLCNLAFALTVFIFQPFIAACENKFMPVNTWWKQLLCLGGVTVILTWLMSLLKPQDGKIAASVALGIGIAVVIQGFLFNEGKLVALNSNSDMLNIVYWLGIVILTVAMAADRLQKEEKKRTAIAMRIAAWILILFQAVNLTVLSTNTEVQHTVHEQVIEMKDEIGFKKLMKLTVKNGVPYFIKDFVGE